LQYSSYQKAGTCTLSKIVQKSHHIRIEGYSISYEKWHEAGLTKTEIFFQGKRFQTFKEFCSKFKLKTNLLNYYGLCHAVPQK